MGQAVKILSVGEVKTKGQNNTKMAEVEVLTLDTKETMKVTCFLGKAETIDLKVSSDYEAEIEEGKPYNGKKQYSMALWKCKEMPKAKEPEVEEEMSKGDWDEKERRSHRRACLAIAAGMLTDKKKDELGNTDVEVAGMVQLTANKLIDFVYNEFDSVKMPEQGIDQTDGVPF